MKYILSLFCLFLLTACQQKQTFSTHLDTTEEQPQDTVEIEEVLPERMEVTEEDAMMYFPVIEKNLGTLKPNEVKSHDFVFYNIGNKPLVIDIVNTFCKCSDAEWPKKPIRPGEKGVIKYTYTASSEPGKFRRSIMISCNTKGDNPWLFVTGVVEE